MLGSELGSTYAQGPVYLEFHLLKEVFSSDAVVGFHTSWRGVWGGFGLLAIASRIGLEPKPQTQNPVVPKDKIAQGEVPMASPGFELGPLVDF